MPSNKTYPKDLYYIDSAIKLHFKDSNFDAIKYRMRIKGISDASFEGLRSFRQYVRWAQKLNERKIHPIEFVLSNVIAGNTLLFQYTLEDYEEWRGRMESIYYKTVAEINSCMEKNSIDKFSKLFKIDDNESDYPPIVNSYLDKNISLETITVINMFVKFTNKLQIVNLGWEDIQIKIQKYEPFLRRMINTEKIKIILLNTYNT